MVRAFLRAGFVRLFFYGEWDMPHRQDAVEPKTVLEWLMPWLLGVLITVGSGMVGMMWVLADRIGELNATARVATTKIEDHDRRINNLETLFFRQSSP